MALTVRELAQLPELGVHLIAGAAPERRTRSPGCT